MAGKTIDFAPTKLSESELATLIRCTSHERFLSIDWLVKGASLQAIESNKWAFEQLNQMRSREE